MEFQVLRVDHYGETPEEDRRITLSPSNIALIAAGIEDVTIRGRSLRTVSILFMEGGSVDLTVNHADLELLEKATGSFCLG